MQRIFLSAAMLLCMANSGTAEELLLRSCLKGSSNPAEIRESKAACTAYLASLMQNIRFGTTIRQPFCLPNRNLTDQEHNLIFKRFSAKNPGLSEMNRYLLSGVITVKANKCSAN
jgi:hypothetical protein